MRESDQGVNIEPLTTSDPAEVAGYRLHGRLGAGGMGRVYLAFTPGGRPVALKMVRPELGDDRDFRNRFYQEVEAARRVHGLYTAQVLDADPVATPPWLVTAYVPGPSLHQAVARHGPMPAETVLVLMAGVAEALQVIHAAGVVHRDLKPSNVLLAPDGPRVIDFGISRAAEATALTRTGTRVGSPQYMAPEQVADRPVTAAADVFALGSLAAFAAVGRAPFGEGSEVAVLYRVLHEPPDLSSCPPSLRGIIERCLAKEPAERPTPAEVVSWCRAQTAGRSQQIARPWLPAAVSGPRPDRAVVPPPAVAAAQAGYAPVSPPARGAAAAGPGRAAVPPLAVPAPRAAARAPEAAPARPGYAPVQQGAPPARLSRRARAAQPVVSPVRPVQPPATASATRRPRRRRGCAARVAMLLIGALILLAVAISAWLHALSQSAGRAGIGGSPPVSATPASSWLTGTWTGAAAQPTGVVTHWTAVLHFSAAGRAGTFWFPSLGCSGTLTVTSATRATASAREGLVRNPRKLCVAGGLMKLTRSGASAMEMAWQDPTRAGNAATARLSLRG